MRRLICGLLAAGALVACGAPQKPMDKEEIRRNADDANADLDRESSKQADQ